MTGRPKNTPDNFWRKIDRRGRDECWPWLRAVRNGYGNHCVSRVTVYAHRYAYFLANTVPPPADRQVMHTCNNKLCCNPRHLKIGTASENTQDAYRDGLARAGVRSHKAKFSTETIEQIRSDPRSQSTLARIYGVSQAHISRIKLGQTRKHEAVNG